MHRWFGVLAALVLAGALSTGAILAQAFPAMPLAELGLPEIVIDTDGSSLELPANLGAARYYLRLENASAAASMAIEFYRMPDGVAAADQIPAFAEAASLDQPPPGFYEILIAGGVSAEPGRTGEAVIDLPAGSWIAALFVYGADADTFLAQPIEVTGDIGRPEDPDADIDLNLEDFGFDLDTPIRAGNLVWEIENDGDQPHFLAIYAYPGELTNEAVDAALASWYGTAPREIDPSVPPIDFALMEEVGGSGTISPDVETWLQLDLPPGAYLAWCQVADADSGLPHAALGQYLIFEVR